MYVSSYFPKAVELKKKYLNLIALNNIDKKITNRNDIKINSRSHKFENQS